MKRIILITALFFGALTGGKAQDGIKYTPGTAFPVYGQAFVASEEHPYRRLPEHLDGVVRDPVWNLGCNSSGLYVRFRSDAPEIHARWATGGNHMPHMTDCGTGGLDLYALISGKWTYVGSGFNWGAPSPSHECRLVGNMEPRMREYMLYLALYDEVKTLEIGVPEGYALSGPEVVTPHSDRPMVMYGTSILQGGCASRPGMAFTNILARRFDRTVINLGFSGNAFLDEEIAQLMASVKTPSVYVLDYVPNASAAMIEEKGEHFFRVLRDAHPDVPVIFVEDPTFAHSVVDGAIAEEVRQKNAAQRALFLRLRKGGEKGIYYVGTEGMTGSDGEAFVDGIHFTDLGMLRYADHIGRTLAKALR
ncbi:MAG: SGNH/GDSL hydrolase family protein [Bacteroidales bacterium]|nr:SGNH/GDSL hydrolase family protein [Bacteroidales bacterium]